MELRSGPTSPPALLSGVAGHAVEVVAAEDPLAALGIALGGDLGDQGGELGRGQRLDLGRDARGTAQRLDQRRIGQSEGIHGAQCQLGGVAGEMLAVDRGGQDGAGTLTVEECGHQGPEVDPLGGRLRDQLGGAGRGGVHIQPGQGGHCLDPDTRGGTRHGQLFDPGPARLATDHRQRLDRRGTQPLLDCDRPGDLPQSIHRRLELPEARQPDRRLRQDRRPRCRSPPEDPDQLVAILHRLHVPREGGLGQRVESLDSDRGREALRHRPVIDEIQVAHGPALADHLDHGPLACLGHAPAREQPGQRTVRRGSHLRPPSARPGGSRR